MRRRSSGQVAAAVGCYAASEGGVELAQPRSGPNRQQLRGLPASDERQRPHLSEHQLRQQQRRLVGRAPAPAVDRVGHGRVPEHEVLAAERRAVVVYDPERHASQAFGVLAGVGKRGGAHDELRVGAEPFAQTAQPPQDVGDVRAEDAPVDVGLVYDDEPQAPEELVPCLVVRQDAAVKHVRVGDDETRAAPDARALLDRRVAVEDVVAYPPAGGRKLRDAAALVPRQRLGGEQKQCPRRPVPRERVEDRQVVAEALAAGRRRGDDDVVPVADGVHGLGLVRVQRLDSGAPEGALERGAQRLPKLPVRGLPFGDGLHVRDLAAVARQRLQVTKEGGNVHGGDCTGAGAGQACARPSIGAAGAAALLEVNGL